MRIAFGTLFLALVVLLNSIELISSIRMMLKQLFPGANGINIPPIQELGHELTQSYRNFRILDYRQMSDPTAITFLQRGNVIVGWKHGNDIKPLSLLFDGHNAFVVFDKNNDQWVTLSKEEFEQLGPNRILPLVRAHDQIAAELSNKHEAKRHVNYEGSQQIHIAASQEANIAANNEERNQMRCLEKQRRVYEYSGSALRIQKAYRQAYSQAYRTYSALTEFKRTRTGAASNVARSNLKKIKHSESTSDA